MNETPTPESLTYAHSFERMSESAVSRFEKIIKAEKWNSEEIKTIAELGCGRGVITRALLKIFPLAKMYAVDFHDLLPLDLRENHRVVFHQGLLSDALASGVLPSPDLVILKDITSTHGFNPENITLLQRFVGLGLLLTEAYNAGLERKPWFKDCFKLVSFPFDDGRGYESAKIWRVKNGFDKEKSGS